MGHGTVMVVYKPLCIACLCRVRSLAPSELNVRASGIAVRFRPHGGIGSHVTAAMGPINHNQDQGQQDGGKKKF